MKALDMILVHATIVAWPHLSHREAEALVATLRDARPKIERLMKRQQLREWPDRPVRLHDVKQPCAPEIWTHLKTDENT
jgi:hypothetical protein